MNLSNQPSKGTSDWFPEEFAVRKYIFDTWRSVCTRFGYQEYLTPLVESADIYRAKSGEDVGGTELTVFRDRGDRELAIRPEMTPSVTRMVSRKYESMPKPIRLFSIANFYRNEKPQKGRNREFWQLNYDVFGSDSNLADVEVVQIAIEIMKELGAPEGSFVVYINDRQLIEVTVTKYLGIEADRIMDAIRLLDKFDKLPEDEFFKQLYELGAKDFDRDQLKGLLSRDEASMAKIRDELLKDEEGGRRLENIVSRLEEVGYSEVVKWNPGMVRGFDYYDGMVFEVFDTNEDNNRSLFGGGRYNGLGALFGAQSFPAVGCAPGDETLRLFLESWDLLDQVDTSVVPDIFIPLLDESLETDILKLASKLRREDNSVSVGFEVQKIGKALEFADKQSIPKVVIFGEDEKEDGVYTLKDMSTRVESKYGL